MPRVSIGLPVMNGEKYLAGAIEAIRAQTFEDFELLISDNASTDRTQEICEQHARQDERVRYVRQSENLGASRNFNYVYHHTNGEFFRWAAYDDLIRPEYLEACVKGLDASPESVLVYPKTVRIDEEGTILGVFEAATRDATGETPSERLTSLIGRGPLEESIIHMCFPIFGLIRRTALERTSLIASMPRSDMLLLVELALKGRFLPLDDELFLRREHDDGSVTAAENAAEGFQELEALLAAWYDPSKGKRYPATLTRLGLGYTKAAMRTSMSFGQKLRSMKVLAGWMGRHWRAIGGEMKIVTRERLFGVRRAPSRA
ncbi:MAG: glycosyltransferase family 2 protein [Planctomycetota bacterium]